MCVLFDSNERLDGEYRSRFTSSEDEGSSNTFGCLVDETRELCNDSLSNEAAIRSAEYCRTCCVGLKLFGMITLFKEWVIVNGWFRLHGYRIRTSIGAV